MAECALARAKEWEAESEGMPGAERKMRAGFKRSAMFAA
jgi:hypothetical protein